MRIAAPMLAMLLFACSRAAPPAENGNADAGRSATANEIAVTSLPEQKPEPAHRPAEVLEEPKGPIDPKSAEAAGQVVQSYGALIEQGRWNEANALWSNAPLAAALQKQLSQYREVHLEIGNPGDPEGAAGSIYVTMPVFFYGDTKDGQPFRRAADVILRRVNDVPGSTEAQQRWHIERIDLGD